MNASCTVTKQESLSMRNVAYTCSEEKLKFSYPPVTRFLILFLLVFILGQKLYDNVTVFKLYSIVF